MLQAFDKVAFSDWAVGDDAFHRGILDAIRLRGGDVETNLFKAHHKKSANDLLKKRPQG